MSLFSYCFDSTHLIKNQPTAMILEEFGYLNYDVSVLYFQSFGHWLFGKQRCMNMDSKQGDQQCEARLQTDTKIQEQGAMCDSGLVIVVLLTSFFVLVALQSIFYSFDYNCNNFYYDDVVGGGIHDPTPTNLLSLLSGGSSVQSQ